MKKKLLCFFALCSVLNVFAQISVKDYQYVIGSAGLFQQDPNNNCKCSVHWTAGELSTSTFKNGVQLNEGFHQGYGYLTDIQDFTDIPIEVNIFPNPTTDVVSITQQELILAKANFFSTDGKQILQVPIDQNITTIDLQQLPANTYFVQLVNNNQQILKSFKLIKIK